MNDKYTFDQAEYHLNELFVSLEGYYAVGKLIYDDNRIMWIYVNNEHRYSQDSLYMASMTSVEHSNYKEKYRLYTVDNIWPCYIFFMPNQILFEVYLYDTDDNRELMISIIESIRKKASELMDIDNPDNILNYNKIDMTMYVLKEVIELCDIVSF